MHVLIPDAHTLSARAVRAQLAAAGHEVHLCHDELDPSDNGFVCSALRTGACPLDDFPIDVVVAVRSWGGSAVAPEEDGVLCAIRRRLPLVVAGIVDGNPYQAWTASEVAGSDVRTAVETAARSVLPEHSRIATEALRSVVEDAAPDIVEASVDVRRHAGGLQVVMKTTPQMSREVAVVAASVVHRALRPFDRWARTIDVSLAPSAGETHEQELRETLERR